MYHGRTLKGNPVGIRDNTRCCKSLPRKRNPYCVPLSEDGKAYGRDKSEDLPVARKVVSRDYGFP